MLNSINYINITSLADIEIAIDNFEKVSREEDSNDIGGGVVIDNIIDDKLDEEESIEEGFKSLVSYLVSLIKIIRAFLNTDLFIGQLIG